MSMMGQAAPLQQLMQMRMQQSQPVGPGQGMGAPQLGAPPAAPEEPQGHPMPNPTNGQAENVLAEFSRASVGGGDVQALAHHLHQLQSMYPKLLMADHKNGHAEMVGPAQEQFLAAAYARAHGAKTAHVRNTGRGQRLHLEF